MSEFRIFVFFTASFERLKPIFDVNFERFLNEFSASYERFKAHIDVNFLKPIFDVNFERKYHVHGLLYTFFSRPLLDVFRPLLNVFHSLFYEHFNFEQFSNFKYKCLGSIESNPTVRRVCKLPLREQLLR